MNPAEIVVHEMERDSSLVILNLFGEGIRQAGESAHAHPHGQVLTLNVAGGDMLGDRVAANYRRTTSYALRSAVVRLALPVIAIQLDQHGVISFCAKSGLYAIQLF